MEALVITLREGIEAALVVGLVLAYLERSGRSTLRPFVYWGLALAVLASGAGAVAASRLGINPENELLEGALLAAAALLVATLAVWMWRAGRGMGRKVEERLATLAGADGGRRQGWALLGFTFFMVFREGVEVILFLAALSLTSAGGLLNAIGGAAGLGLAVLFGFLFARGALRIDLRRFFAVTAVVLVILVLRLLAGSVHEFSEAGLLPSSPAELRVVGFITRDTTSVGILILLILVPALAILPSLRRGREAEAARAGERPAARRRRVAELRRARRWQVSLVGVTMAITIPLAGAVYSESAAAYRPAPQAVQADGRAVRIATDALETGRIAKFVYAAPRTQVRFLLVKRSENDVAVVLDACNICPPRGYRQEKDQVICENCDAPINFATIGMPGGCNPRPLAATRQDGAVLIDVAALTAAEAAFVG